MTIPDLNPFGSERRPLYEVKANLFKGLAHPVRVRVLEVLSAGQSAGQGSGQTPPGHGVSVAELITDTGLEASHLSQHLSVLRRYNLVVAERRGSQVFYRLAYPQVAELLTVVRSLLVDILSTTQAQLESTVNMSDADLSLPVHVDV